jgi:hypothetical protein
MSNTKFLNPNAKKVMDPNSYESLGPASVVRTTTVAASATAFQLDTAANTGETTQTGAINDALGARPNPGALRNRRRVKILVAGATDEVYIGFDSTVSASNGIPVVQAAPLELLLSELVPIWCSGAGTVTLYEEAMA